MTFDDHFLHLFPIFFAKYEEVRCDSRLLHIPVFWFSSVENQSDICSDLTVARDYFKRVIFVALNQSRVLATLHCVPVCFQVFGLGNKTYEHYNAMGKYVDKRLEQLGATRIFDLGMGDDDGK